MARPRHENPTPGELEVLRILWDAGPRTVRQVMTVLNRTRRRAYTSVMSLMNVMAEKGLLSREPKGRAFVYSIAQPRESTLARMVGDLVDRAFEGSTSAMVARLLECRSPSQEELDEIRKTIAAYGRSAGRDKGEH